MSSLASKPRIVTHSGTFHADEVLGCFMLRCLPEFKISEIVRTRDPEIWKTATIILDVGSEYNFELRKFDHHQREFNDTFSKNHQTRLSSAGLIYKHYGKEIIQEIVPETKFSEEQLDLLHTKIYEDLIEAFDAIDNGIDAYPKDITLKYQDHTGLSSIVARLNPFDFEAADEMACFEKAMQICGSHFERTVRFYGLSWLPSRKIVHDTLAARSPNDRYLVFTTFVPWKNHLLTLEENMKIPKEKQVLYVVFPDKSGSWRVQCVPKSSGSFENRKSLPQAWCGLRDEALDSVTGVPGGIFVHAGGFIGGHKTKEGALALAKLAIQA